MAEHDYPLLVFPEPAPTERARRPSGIGTIRSPDRARQGQRLTPQFQRLQDALARRSIALQDNPLGIQPEMVLVIETVGSVSRFINAVGKVDGLEWLGEYELEDIHPEYGFEHESDPSKLLKGQLFVVMTDQEALRQLSRLFKRWKNNPDRSFPRGLTPFKRVFQHLYNIRPWGAEDRIKETGILEDWRDRILYEEDHVPFEVELWYRENAERRQAAESQFREIMAACDGEVVSQCVVPEIKYHALLGRLRPSQIQAIIEDQSRYESIKLLQCDDLMYVRPVGQCRIPVSDPTKTASLLDDELDQFAPPGEPADGEPEVALFDGMPLTGHQFLQQYVIVHDPDGHESAYQVRERAHGTAMASLICHGDLNQQDVGASRRLYVRPILKPRRGFDGHFIEVIPEDVLPIDLVHRAVRQMFESENGNPPAAPGVRIINLSVCDSARPFVREMSAWARLLDWLAWNYQVLFIVSAGNQANRLELDVPRSRSRELSRAELERSVIKSVVSDGRNRRILSPAESLNSLTVSACHADASLPLQTMSVDPFLTTGLPSVTSAQGPGYLRAIKPDILFPGGRQFVDEEFGASHERTTLGFNNLVTPPGQRVAAPGIEGDLNRTIHTRGTSNAAALASRGRATLLGLIDNLRDPSGNRVPVEFDVVLVKAILVHGADWSDAMQSVEAAIKTRENKRNFNELLGRYLGYGLADVAKVMNCTERRVTVLGFGALDDEEGALFRFPLPPSLSAQKLRRRLTISLAWLSPVNASHRKYRIAHLWFNLKGELAPKRMFADHRAVTRGTVQHEILEGHKAMAFQDGDDIEIKISCRADAGDILAPVRFGLAVTLEVFEEENVLFPISIYEEVRERLAVRVPVQAAGAG